MTKKSLEELEREYAQNLVRLEQYQHKSQRLENRVKYYLQGERKKRTHRLITRGGAVESVAPKIRDMSESDFYVLMEQVFSLPEVGALMRRTTETKDGE